MALTSHDGRLLLSHPRLHQECFLSVAIYPSLLLSFFHCLQEQAGPQHAPTVGTFTGLRPGGEVGVGLLGGGGWSKLHGGYRGSLFSPQDQEITQLIVHFDPSCVLQSLGDNFPIMFCHLVHGDWWMQLSDGVIGICPFFRSDSLQVGTLGGSGSTCSVTLGRFFSQTLKLSAYLIHDPVIPLWVWSMRLLSTLSFLGETLHSAGQRIIVLSKQARLCLMRYLSRGCPGAFLTFSLLRCGKTLDHLCFDLLLLTCFFLTLLLFPLQQKSMEMLMHQ